MSVFALKDLLSKSIERLLIAIAPTIFSVSLLLEERLADLFDTIPSLWRFRALTLFLSLSLLLAVVLYLKRAIFTEYRGALFKPKSDGSYHEVVYCHSCKTSTSHEGDIPFLDRKFKCKCGWISSFNLGEFNEFFKTISKRV
jgi:hypothetical protein